MWPTTNYLCMSSNIIFHSNITYTYIQTHNHIFASLVLCPLQSNKGSDSDGFAILTSPTLVLILKNSFQRILPELKQNENDS